MLDKHMLIRFPKVKEFTGLSRSTIDRLERKGEFPQRRKLSTHAVAWNLSEVQDWIRLRGTSQN